MRKPAETRLITSAMKASSRTRTPPSPCRVTPRKASAAWRYGHPHESAAEARREFVWAGVTPTSGKWNTLFLALVNHPGGSYNSIYILEAVSCVSGLCPGLAEVGDGLYKPEPHVSPRGTRTPGRNWNCVVDPTNPG